jgi:hypothetical protein
MNDLSVKMTVARESSEAKEIETMDEFRREYFPRDLAEESKSSDPEAIGRELARRSAVLVRSAFGYT